jgi:multicomponent Na+:H+ antiporter subunit E
MSPVLGSLGRGLGLFGLWLVLFGADAAGLAVGAVTAAAAAWLSLRLLPPGPAKLRPAALVGLIGRLAWQSVVAGVDVARRAFDPRLPLHPGYIRHRLSLPPGPRRPAFLALASLLPGSLPADVDADGMVLIHGLDLGQPVADEFALAESRFAAVRRSG